MSEQFVEQFPTLVDSVRVVSHRSGETYDEFITRIIHSGDPIALLVKLADMSVNLGSNPTEPGVRERYERNIGRLHDAVAASR